MHGGTFLPLKYFCQSHAAAFLIKHMKLIFMHNKRTLQSFNNKNSCKNAKYKLRQIFLHENFLTYDISHTQERL